MRKNTTTKRQTRPSATPAQFVVLPLKEITAPPINTRQTFDEDQLAELAASIKREGLWQPILVRTLPAPQPKGVKYQIVFGERRWRAAQLAGLREIPARVQALDDAAACEAQISENLQREELHPLEEAQALHRLKAAQQLDLAGLAAAVAKDKRYVARRLALTDLIPAAQADWRAERLTLAHALELCRLAPEVQAEALDACYEPQYRYDEATQQQVCQPDKERPARHVAYLREWLVRHVYLDLQRAPFKLTDTRLREDGLACLACPQRTGANQTLFADIHAGDRCLHPGCFQAKLNRFVQLQKTDLEAKQGSPVAFISPHYYTSAATEGVLGRDQFELLPKKADRCAHAEQAVVAEGEELGRLRWICRAADCPDHQGRAPESYRFPQVPHSHSTAGNAEGQRQERKQELFDIKVAEAVRKRVLPAALATYQAPLERPELNTIARVFFRRLPMAEQHTVGDVLGWAEEDARRYRHDEAALDGWLTALSETELARLLVLCAVAHHGANPAGQQWVDQSAVEHLAQARGVNYLLLDAEVRAELCPKKYAGAHAAYLQTVREGRAGEKPIVYERTTTPA